MIKKIFLIVAFMIIFSQSVFAEEKDVTGDGINEKIYKVVDNVGGNTPYYRLIVQQKMANGEFVNIFPEWTSYMSGEEHKFFVEKYKIVFSSYSGYVFEKFSNHPGLQFLICMGCNKSRREGYFFKKETNDEKFVLYRKDVTDNKYDGGFNSHKEEIITEFKGKTNFTRAFEAASNYLKSLIKGTENGSWDNAYSFCDNNSRWCVDSYKKLNFNKIKNVRLKSYCGKVLEENNRSGSYVFDVNDRALDFVILINKNFKVCGILGRS